MLNKIYITYRIRNIIILMLSVLFLSLAAFTLLSTRSWINRPFPGFLVMKNNSVPSISLSEWEGIRRGIKFEDIIVAVDGKRVSNADELDNIILKHKPGAPLTYTVVRGKIQKQTLEITIPVSVFSANDYLAIFLAMILGGMVMYITGLAVFYLKPNSMVSWTFLALYSSAGIVWAAGPEYITNHVNCIPHIGIPLTFSLWPLSCLYFPVEIKSRRYFIWFLLITTIPLVFLNVYYFSRPLIYIYIDTFNQFHALIMLSLGFILLGYSFITSKDPIIHQRRKLVIYGILLFSVCLSVCFIGVIILKKMSGLWAVIPILLTPVWNAYVITKHNVFDVDVIIRRSFSYLVVSGFMIMLFFGLIAIFSIAFQDITGQSSQIAAVLTTLLLVLVFRPLQTRLDKIMDRRFYKEKYEYQATIRKASNVLISIINLDQLLNQLLDTVLEAIKIERGCIMLKDDESERLDTAVARGYQENHRIEPVSLQHPLIMHLNSQRKAVQRNDIEELFEFRENRQTMLKLMHDLKIVLLIPILYERRIKGIFGVGEKMSGEWYSSEDIDLLQTLINQTAVSIENARKVEELKRMVELETSYRELKKLDEMKSNFLSMVSHDLRTPMTSIQGYASILLEKRDRLEQERQTRYLTIIINESKRLIRLINDLLDLQRFEAGKMQLSFEDIDLNDIIRQSVDAFQGAAFSKHITLDNNLPESHTMIHGNTDRLSQVMANLLSNALKFTPDGGRVNVSMEKLDESGKSAVKVSVSDNGPGIPKEKQPQLFTKFQQVEGMVRSKEQGSGLGLALVREIVEHHGGRVGVESEPGKGSVFYFVVQVVQAQSL